MELKATAQDTHSAQDEREWELADEDLDRAVEPPARGSSLCSTSRPCSCQRCHCR
jgi:hypothetical protein